MKKTEQHGAWPSRAGRRSAILVSTLLILGAATLPAFADDPGLPQTAAEATKMEQDDALPITAFYDTPSSLATSKPGDLLRQESVTDYALPARSKATRILYHSKNADGSDVATSGVVLVPAGSPPAGGWPVIAWAHGTSGVARQCAPSAMKDVYYGEEGLSDMLKGGFAVIATDYHGLGTEGPHHYMDKVAQANDIINSVPAARAAVPSLGKNWVVDGHSQGGLAAWAVAEQQLTLKDPTYRGAVAVAGAIHLGWMLSHPEAAKGAGFYLAWHAYAVQAAYPAFKPTDMLSDKGYAHYADVSNNGCWLYGFATYNGVEVPQMVKPDWQSNPWVKKFFTENSAGSTPIGGPIFVIAGEADSAVPIDALRAAVKQACAKKEAVTFRSYPGLDHDPTMSVSTPDQLAWIKARLNGQDDPGNCPQ